MVVGKIYKMWKVAYLAMFAAFWSLMFLQTVAYAVPLFFESQVSRFSYGGTDGGYKLLGYGLLSSIVFMVVVIKSVSYNITFYESARTLTKGIGLMAVPSAGSLIGLCVNSFDVYYSGAQFNSGLLKDFVIDLQYLILSVLLAFNAVVAIAFAEFTRFDKLCDGLIGGRKA